jgi:hypothetical protein
LNWKKARRLEQCSRALHPLFRQLSRIKHRK